MMSAKSHQSYEFADRPVRILSAADRPDLRAAGDTLAAATWPAFLDADSTTGECWDRLYDSAFAQFQLFALRTNANGDETLVATANTVPFFWSTPEDDGSLSEEGWGGVLAAGVKANALGQAVNALSALSVVVSTSERGSDLAERMLLSMRNIAKAHGLQAMVAPIRPTRKSQYPLETMETYLSWTTENGEPFDPWIRKHHRLGARIVGIAGHSMKVCASVPQWSRWTGLRFPASGRYHVPGGLAPVEVDLAMNQGVYHEPNVWMRHF